MSLQIPGPALLSDSVSQGGGGGVPVGGPGSSTDYALAAWNGTGGNLLRNTVLITDANGNLTQPSTATVGHQLFNTVDQATTYQRVRLYYGSSVAMLGTDTFGTIAQTPLYLYSQVSNAGSGFGRLDIGNANSLPLLRQGSYTTSTGTAVASTSATGTFVSMANISNVATSGVVVAFAITPLYNQASGTATNTDFLVNRTQTAVGSGTQRLLDLQVGGVPQFNVSNTGVTNVCAATATPAAGSTSARLVFGTTAGFGVYYGSGAPTVSAAQGSIYLRSDGSGVADRLYVNTTGSTTWTNFVSAA